MRARGTVEGDAGGLQMATVAKVLVDDEAVVDVVAYIRTLDVKSRTKE